jgi:hypothetical protein
MAGSASAEADGGLGTKPVQGLGGGHGVAVAEAADVAENAAHERLVAVAAFEDADDSSFDGRALLLGEVDDVARESCVKVGRHEDVVSLHPVGLVLRGIEAGRYENGRLWLCVSLELRFLLGLSLQKRAHFV